MIPQHSLPGGRYPLPGPDFHRLDRASFAWRTRTDSQAQEAVQWVKPLRKEADADVAHQRIFRKVRSEVGRIGLIAKVGDARRQLGAKPA